MSDSDKSLAERYLEEARWSTVTMYSTKEECWVVSITDHDNDEVRKLHRSDPPPYDESHTEMWEESETKS